MQSFPIPIHAFSRIGGSPASMRFIRSGGACTPVAAAYLCCNEAWNFFASPNAKTESATYGKARVIFGGKRFGVIQHKIQLKMVLAPLEIHIFSRCFICSIYSHR
jgi:hypothetical protein